VWQYSNLRLAERTQSLEQGPQAPAWEVFSNDEECQGSDADGVDKKTDCLKLFFISLKLLTLSEVTERGNEQERRKGWRGGPHWNPHLKPGFSIRKF